LFPLVGRIFTAKALRFSLSIDFPFGHGDQPLGQRLKPLERRLAAWGRAGDQFFFTDSRRLSIAHQFLIGSPCLSRYL